MTDEDKHLEQNIKELKELADDGMITDSHRSKSVGITEAGERK